MAGGTVTATWTGSNSRDPIVAATDAPPAAPLAVAVANQAGQWLFAVCSWRQDDSTPVGQIAYPSTISVCDDAGNFWIPVESGQPSAGITRCSVWMAPAARPAQYVFFSPCPTSDAAPYQAALTAMVAEVTADCPWYSVALNDATFTNQGTAVTLTDTIPTGAFAIGVIAFDSLSAGVTLTTSGWSSRTTVSTNNGTDGSGDLQQCFVFATGAGSSMTISGAATSAVDFAITMIAVHGVTDTLAFPYPLPMENWPVLITEMASGPVANADPVFASGTAHWGATNGAVAAVTWPLWNPWPSYGTFLSGSVSLTPTGSATTCHLIASDEDAVTPTGLYSAVAYVYSPGGWPTADVFVSWFDSSHTPISTTGGQTTALLAGAWTQLTWAAPLSPPVNAAFGSVGISEFANSGNVPSSAVLYVGYCGFGPADSYEGAPPDQIQWTDFSSRNYTFQSSEIERGIQYEQQQLEAGTGSVTLHNEDGALTFGNVLSSLWPTAGDTDVPFQVRAVWPGSPTPYYPLFSGYTDQMEFGWDDPWYGYCKITGSDAWSRLTQQLLSCVQQELGLDNPLHLWPCNVSGADNAIGAQAQALTVTTGPFGAGAQTQAFGSTGIQLQGAPGVSCWQTAATPASGNLGSCLTWFPQTVLPVGNGITVEFWYSPTEVSASQPTGPLVVASMWSRKGAAWTLWIDNSNGFANSFLYITVYDKNTLAATNHKVGSVTFLGATAAPGAFYAVVSFTTTSITVTVDPGNPNTTETGTFSCNLNLAVGGFTFGGNGGPVGTEITAVSIPITSYGFSNGAYQFISIYQNLLCLARSADHFTAGLNAFQPELDTWRIARIAGYSGFTPALAMRCLDLTPPPGRDLDLVTGATDTNSQVVSAYLTNIASTTLAGMFVDGAGSLVYRRRLEWYDRALPQWVTGEDDPLTLSLGVNPLNGGAGTSGWGASNGATLAVSSNTVNALFYPSCGVFHGDGSTSSGQITYGSVSGTPVTVGGWYTASLWVYSPQGFTSGLELSIRWFNVSSVQVGSAQTYTLSALAAGTLAYLQVPATRAPATTAFALIVLRLLGAAPPSTSLCYVAGVLLTTQAYVQAGGANATAPETPYTGDVRPSSDRAQLYNQAILTQYGTNLVQSFTGNNVTFTPSSGVIVLINNQPSVNQRGGVPYTVTLYTDNTIQALPYYFDDPSMEDFGNWVTQTLGSPLFRPETVSIQTGASPSALPMGLGAEVGDTSTFRRRPLGAAEIQMLTYLSKLSHEIDREAEDPWVTKYEMSPFQVGSVLACDDVVHGCGTGGNLIGF